MSDKNTELHIQQIKVLERLTTSSEYQTKTLDKILEFFNNGFKDEIIKAFSSYIEKQNKELNKIGSNINWIKYVGIATIGSLIGVIIKLIL